MCVCGGAVCVCVEELRGEVETQFYGFCEIDEQKPDLMAANHNVYTQDPYQQSISDI